VIRRAVAADLDAILELERGVPECAHWSREEYERMLAGAGEGALRRWALVVEADHEICGFVVVKTLDSGGEMAAEIENLAVKLAARRRGLARKLCGEAERQLRESGVRVVDLEVRESNVAARGLYAEAGFREVGRRVKYYASPCEDGVLMRKEIAVA